MPRSPSAPPPADRPDRPREACGVLGLALDPALAHPDVIDRVEAGLRALQHRGEESAGVAVSDGADAEVHTGMGLVGPVFTRADRERLRGHLAIGHTRYSTTGASHLRNAQPYLVETFGGPLAVAHNGNLTNVDALRARLLRAGAAFTGASDSEVIARLLARTDRPDPAWEAEISRVTSALRGAWALTLLTRGAVFGARDPHGLRPLCLGAVVHDGATVGHALASETVGLAACGARFLREVAPGEVVRLDGRAVQSWQGPAANRALCAFEFVYFARPDSELDGGAVGEARARAGARLAREAPAAVDIVVHAPDSGRPAAAGFADALGVPHVAGLVKDAAVGRTFIAPTEAARAALVARKYRAIPDLVAGRRVALVDDSIVRGTTIGPLVRRLRDAGAAEVHVRIASPPIRHPCALGVDLDDREHLIAHRMDAAAIGAAIGADSVAWLSVDGLEAALAHGGPGGYCTGCFTGRWPVPPPERAAKRRFEPEDPP